MPQKLLRSCSVSRNIIKGWEVHSQIVKEGGDRDSFLGSGLVDMYVKCSSFIDASFVFGNLATRDVVSWTALIAGYADHGFSDQAVICLQQMKVEGLSPNAVTYLCSLKAFRCREAMQQAYAVHADLIRQGFDQDLYVGCTLADMYGKCGLLQETQVVFNYVPLQSVVLWNTLTTMYAENGFSEEILHMLDQMQVEGVSPDAVTFALSLKSCGILGAYDTGLVIHVQITKHGLENADSVGNTLVDMYSKCGLLAEVQAVFNNLLVQDVVSWTALISGYIEQGFHDEAVACFQKMMLLDVVPDATTYVGVLRAISCQKDISIGQQLHLQIIEDAYETNVFVGNSLVDMYGQCGLLSEAHEVLIEMPFRDVISWNALITACIEYELEQNVSVYFRDMVEDSVSPDAVSYMCILRASSYLCDIVHGQETHIEIVKMGFENDTFVANTLIDMYAKCGLFVDVNELFNELPVQDVAAWTALISGYADHRYNAEALYCFELMHLKGVSSNIATFLCCLKACGNIKSIEKGRSVHAEMVRRGFEKHPSGGSGLVDMYSKCGFLDESQYTFDDLSLKDDASLNALLWGYAECSQTALVLQYIEKMYAENVVPDVVYYGSMLKACGLIGAVYQGQQIHIDIVKRAFEMDAFLTTVLFGFYSKCGLNEEARNTSSRVPVHDTVSWNTLIAGYVEHGDYQGGLHSFFQMQVDGAIPDEITFLCILRACGNLGSLNGGRDIHRQVAEEEHEMDAYIGNALVDMYSKCGSMNEAQEVFDNLPARNLISWNALFAGYANQGEPGPVYHLLEKMGIDGAEPNATTFLSILAVCNHAGLMDHGQWYFEAFSKSQADWLTLYHLNCLLDILGRAGQLDAVRLMSEQMPFQPNNVTWHSMLASCRKWKNVDIAEWAFVNAASLGQCEASICITMANIYLDGHADGV